MDQPSQHDSTAKHCNEARPCPMVNLRFFQLAQRRQGIGRVPIDYDLQGNRGKIGAIMFAQKMSRLSLVRPNQKLQHRDVTGQIYFVVKYNKGKVNGQADAFSRLFMEGETVDAIDDEIPCFMAELADATEE